ncbi:MAG TPA: lysylphosphatidylglycerol synthase domain-containing protein, partial [Syntrophorhabdaceae bacterium]|nr:lysylphosphatidylglycerol synthase domain-containing protein [Syntrophorhabdaceae bacterium]
IIDSIVVWFIIMAFGWQLPFFAAITLAVFIEAGSSLPSAPGYIGIFQIACVLALKIYSVDESSAVAFSVVFQLLTFTLIFFQGILAAIQNSFGILSAMRVVSRKVPTE